MREEIERSALGPLQSDEQGGLRSFRFNEAFVGFAGHFPDYPILPAVLQALLAQMVAEQLLGEPADFLALERAKFTRQLRPGEQIEVKVRPRDKGENHWFACELSVGEEKAASFTLVLSAGEGG